MKVLRAGKSFPHSRLPLMTDSLKHFMTRSVVLNSKQKKVQTIISDYRPTNYQRLKLSATIFRPTHLSSSLILNVHGQTDTDLITSMSNYWQIFSEPCTPDTFSNLTFVVNFVDLKLFQMGVAVLWVHNVS